MRLFALLVCALCLSGCGIIPMDCTPDCANPAYNFRYSGDMTTREGAFAAKWIKHHRNRSFHK